VLTYDLLVDRGEIPQKCTILPLAYRPDFHIRRFDLKEPIARLESGVLLHVDGAPLDELAPSLRARGVRSIALIDTVWKRCERIVDLIEKPLPPLARIPDGFLTAYPRRNKKNLDPDGGLATIEALFIAAAFLGTWDETLLAEYYFADRFLTANQSVFARFGLGPHAKPAQAVPE
jgi:pre-rRNA-processing protein TSR3